MMDANAVLRHVGYGIDAFEVCMLSIRFITHFEEVYDRIGNAPQSQKKLDDAQGLYDLVFKAGRRIEYFTQVHHIIRYNAGAEGESETSQMPKCDASKNELNELLAWRAHMQYCRETDDDLFLPWPVFRMAWEFRIGKMRRMMRSVSEKYRFGQNGRTRNETELKDIMYNDIGRRGLLRNPPPVRSRELDEVDNETSEPSELAGAASAASAATDKEDRSMHGHRPLTSTPQICPATHPPYDMSTPARITPQYELVWRQTVDLAQKCEEQALHAFADMSKKEVRLQHIHDIKKFKQEYKEKREIWTQELRDGGKLRLEDLEQVRSIKDKWPTMTGTDGDDIEALKEEPFIP